MPEHRILVVDDEPKVAFFFQKHLEMIDDNYMAKAVNSGNEALQELKKQSYDLLITDLRMPQMDGLELLRCVRQISPQTQTILVTAYGSDDVWEEAERLQIFRALDKPLKIPDLLACVREALVQSSHRASGVLTLTGENFELLAECLDALRMDLGARATVLADTTGRILVYSGSVDELELSATMALLGGTMAACGELSQQLQYARPVHLSYFEGPPYDLYTTNVGYNFFLTIFHDRRKEASRIGLVWLYTRRTLEQILDLMGRKTTNEATSLENGFAESLQQELNTFFDSAKTPAGNESPVGITPPQTTSPPEACNFSDKIGRILERFGQQTGLAIESYLAALDNPLPPTFETLVLKTIREGLKNVYEHAQATIVGVSFSRDGRILHGRIADNGVGFDMDNHPPLRSLAELQKAFHAANGKLEISAYPNQGTNLNFQLILPAKVAP